ncbi:hypothetical protein [Mucilaginibacter sp.]|uniref:hypothetical protein n=1 Tax=Mucilaginibacter sp. TaxID=1882438 RepID=UPI0025FB936D|nr:hypothetical protein [Mucilaginibacter sp.]
MKNKPIILLLTAVLAMTRFAIAQTHGNFSDWNVPAPQAPATIQKGATHNKPAIAPQFIDVPPVNVPQTGPAQISKMPPVLLVAPEVITPIQPTIQGLSAGSFGTPLPAAPDIPALPAEAPHDDIFKMTADVNAPAAPPMPELPKSIPADAPVGKPGGSTRLPVTPSIESQPLQVEVSNGRFSFSEWAVPAILGDTEVLFQLPDATPPKELPKPKQAGKKMHKTSNSN